MKLHLPKGLRLAVLSCSTGFAVACSTAQAADISITTNTTWGNNNDHAADATTVSGATLTINNNPAATAGTTYNYGTITVTNSGTLALDTWTGGASDIRDVSTGTRPIIASNITLDNSTLQVVDGSYEFSGTVTIAGNSKFVNEWSKGHVIHTLASSGDNAQLTYQCSNTGWANTSPLTILNEGTYSGRVVMDNQSAGEGRIGYLVLKNANALGNGTTVVDLGSGAYDTRNHLSVDTETINLKGLAGKGVVEKCSLAGNAGVASTTVNIINSGINEGENPIAASDAFSGTISAGITVDASNGTLVLGQITNNGTLVSGENGKIVLASDHAGITWGEGVLDASGNVQASGNGFGYASSISLFTEGSTNKTVGGTGEVYFSGAKYTVGSDGTISNAADYDIYVVRTSDAGSSELGTAKNTASSHGVTLENVRILDGGVLTITIGNGENGFVSGNAGVEAGGKLVLSAHDALGWRNNNNTATSSITLEGESDSKKATMEIGAVQTLTTNINLKGNTVISSTAAANILQTYGSTIHVTGTSNTISAGIMDRDALTLQVDAGATLNITGRVEQKGKDQDGYDVSGTPSMHKTGAGKVTFSGANSSFSSTYTQGAGETVFSGANTTLGHGLAINDGRVVADAGEGNSVTVTGVTGSGKLGVKSGTLKVSGLNTTGLLELGYNTSQDQQGRGSQVVELSGTGNRVNQIDASMGGTANGTLRMKENSSLQVSGSTWLHSAATILLEEGAELTTNQKIKITGTAQEAGKETSFKTTAGNVEYMAGNANITITNAIVTSTDSDTGTTLENLLKDTTLVNAGSTVLKAANEGNTYKGIEAINGDIIIQRSDATSMSVEDLKINANHGVGVQVQEGAIGGGSLTVTKTAVFGSDSTLNADLTLGSGSSLDLGGAVTLGEGNSLILGSGITLANGLLSSIQGLAAGESFELFKVQGSVTLNGTEYSLAEGGVAMEDIDASTIFNGLEQCAYLLKFEALPQVTRAAGGGGIFYVEAVTPEPTTSTLSLLALAALAARRRRK